MHTQDFISILQKYWGYPSFRSSQFEIISSVAEGRDTFAILPTGGGKSLCYQVPALYFDGLTLVISPLIALMEDQVKQLHQRNIEAAFIHSGVDTNQQTNILNRAIRGEIKILYIAPERAVSPTFEDYLYELPISFIAIDESHCISQWGHDFRPSYLELTLLREIHPKVPILAVTASATPIVQKDIAQYLALKDFRFFSETVVRPNLTYKVNYSENKFLDIVHLAKEEKATGIVYANSRKLTRALSNALKQEGIHSTFYNAGLDLKTRNSQQSIWMESDQHIMVATNAFGMGIDKPNVRFVSHFLLPYSLEEYYQEAGRAGRDSQAAQAILLYNEGDLARMEESIDIQFPDLEWVKSIYHRISDYLKIASGAGEDEIFVFSLDEFIAKQKLDTRKVLSAIRLIQQEGYWNFEYDSHTQNRLLLHLRTEDMESLKIYYPKYHDIIITVLRLYGTVHHFESVINLKTIAQKMEITQFDVHQSLLNLMKMGYLVYKPAEHGSYIHYLQARQSPRYFNLSKNKILKLKQAYEYRLKSFRYYIKNQDTCRDLLIAKYFGQDITSLKDCGQCDNCLRKRIVGSSRATMQTMQEELLIWIKENQPLDPVFIQQNYKKISPEELTLWIRQFIDKGMLKFDEFGKIISSS